MRVVGAYVKNLIGLGLLAVAAVLLVYKLWHARSMRHSPRTWAILSMVSCFAVSMAFSVPTVSVWTAQHTGVPNIGRILTYSLASGAGASSLCLALVWRYPAPRAWLTVRWVIAVYAAANIVFWVLFAVSPVPEERPTDFPTHYAHLPTISAFLLLFCVSNAIAFGVLGRWCLTWARSGDFTALPWLRWGLRLYGATGVVITTMVTLGVGTIVGTWLDRDMQPLFSVATDVLLPIATVLLLLALTVPVAGPAVLRLRDRVAKWRAFFALRALHVALRTVAPDNVMVAHGRTLDPHHRVRRALIELNDWRATLNPLFSPAVRQAEEERGRNGGLRGEDLDAMVEAAQLSAALELWNSGMRRLTPSGADAGPAERTRDGNGTIDDELAWWTGVARAHSRRVRLSPETAAPRPRGQATDA
ncbi:MAB_1171c family putative transporter [Streptomyces sp. NPDC005017]|uniref:MAB_1171c family putative transporter n=1 Tax=Streptomyces sp. NPDC005017 TaxID=3364706 RepID=UPI003694661D